MAGDSPAILRCRARSAGAQHNRPCIRLGGAQPCLAAPGFGRGGSLRREAAHAVMVLGHRHELVAEPRGGFRRAKHEIAVGSKPRRKTGEDRALGGVVEIDEHIPAEDHVEHPERLAIVEEIMRAELDRMSG